MIKQILTFKALITVLIGVVYLGGLVWALVTGQLDIKSYIAGIGPMFGMTLSAWFKGDGGGAE